MTGAIIAAGLLTAVLIAARRSPAPTGTVGVETAAALAGALTAVCAGHLGGWAPAAVIAAPTSALACTAMVTTRRRWAAARADGRRHGTLAATALGLLALAGAGWLAWTYQGTNDQAHDHMREQVTDFYEAAGQPGDGIARLRTDLTTDPPPTTDTTGPGTWGLLIVPAWAGAHGAYDEDLSTRIPIAAGTSAAVLDRGWAGHFDQSAGPGQVGNMALAGHRRTKGQSFNHLDQLADGDALVIETPHTWYVYQVTGTPETVAPTAIDEIAPVPHHPDQPPTTRMATLTTCTSTTVGQWGNDHRLAVHATFLGWAPRTEGIPPQLAAPTP